MADWLETIETCCKELEREPLLAASLGSKELFHSNLIGWLMDRAPAVAHSALEPWWRTEPGRRFDGVWREYHNLDLVIERSDHAPMIIENKMFSIPDEDQLDRYDEVNIPAGKVESGTKLLLSLTDPGWPQRKYEGWTWVPYPEFAERVDMAVAESTDRGCFDDFTAELVRRWHRMVDVLDEISHAVAPYDLDSPYLIDSRVLSLLQPLRLGDAFQKARNFGVRKLVKTHLQAAGHDFDIEANFTNGQPLLSLYIDMPDESLIGWQLQGVQWRRCVIVPPELSGTKSTHDVAIRTQYVDAMRPPWIHFTGEDVASVPPARNGGYRHYSPGFVYNYVRVPAITIREVLARAERTVRAAVAYRDAYGKAG